MTAPPALFILTMYTTRQLSLSQNVSLLVTVHRLTYFIVIEGKSSVIYETLFVPKLTPIASFINNRPHMVIKAHVLMPRWE